MSFVIRRQLSTLIPPKIASAKNLGSNPAAKRMEQVVSFYKKLPQGEASFPKPSGLIGRYRAKHFDGDNASGAPLLHISVAIIALGYSLEYYFHLRHHHD
ncbi:hypothetical protein PACTADRAFT_36924 [Pachysolen tannophilus NRRL Y-2460]|uniref:Uncharacterized protein n=1 Tax=Pachysolen tannophilus NRRL Y-2460 TaxID=669874 RepID=A0A1E4U0H0_PACTA|nr:hypothetical protein PACTADRAFT_36924 [Pachysolen tannophilus NRRL Y-2460]